MPIYEYICQDCGLRFDYLARSSQDCVMCPECKHKNLRRLISAFSFNSKDASGNTMRSSSGCSSCSSYNCSTCSR